jgi:flagellar hook-associated protein 3 FlgL
VSEIGQIKAQIMSQADTKYLGRSIFSGTSSSGSAYDPSTYAFSGVAGDSVTRLVGQNRPIKVDADGAAAFGQGATSVFAELDNLSSAISSGTGVPAQLAVIDKRIQSVMQTHAQVGISQSAVISAQSDQLTNKTNLTADKSAVEDIDFASAYMQLQSAQNVQSASLAVLAKLAKSPQLQDYL